MIGRLLRNVHAGKKKLTCFCEDVADAPETIVVTSAAFAHNAEVPIRYTGYGENISPPLAWMNLPVETLSVVLVLEDPDAPLPMPIVHTIVYGLGPEDCLREGEIPSAAAVVADKFKLGRGTFGMSAYRGPGPIADHGPHAYYFQIFALDCALSFAAAPRKKEIVAAMKGYVLAKGVLVGTYERRSGQ